MTNKTLQHSVNHLTHPKYRPDIDGLRAIAILAVVGFHAFPNWIHGGFIGVDIFFVISGYLISTIIMGSLERNSFCFAEFYIRRINRIFPALILVLGACFAFGWFALLADEYKQLGKHIAGGAGFISNFMFWGESGYFDNAAETKPLLHLWSLGVEEQFYIVWPLLLWFVWKNKFNLLTVTLLVAFISFALNLSSLNEGGTEAAFYSPQSRFWELFIGSVLAYITAHHSNMFSGAKHQLDIWLGKIIYRHAPEANGKTLRNVQSLLGVMFFVIGFSLITREDRFPGWWALLPTLGAVFIISAGTQAWFNRVVLSNKVLVWFGLISFPLYLWHWPLLSFARIMEDETPSRWIRIAAVLISVVLAWLTYRLIESPIRLGGRSKFKAITLLVIMSLVGGVGYNAYQRDGLSFRSAAKVAHINRFDAPYRQGCDAITGEIYGDDWCNIGTSNVNAPNAALIGDSYSNAYSTMLNEYAKNAATNFSFIQFGRGQCPSLNDYGPAYCRQITSKIFDYIVSNENIKTVVLATQWVAYYNGKGFRWVNYRETPEAFKVAFEKTIHAYKEKGKKVIVFLAPPVGSNPKACLIRPIRLTNKTICSLPLETAIEKDGKYRDYLIPKLQSENIKYFDPFPYFCDAVSCKIIDGNKILSADGGHLSIYGGEFLANQGRVELNKIFWNIPPQTPQQ